MPLLDTPTMFGVSGPRDAVSALFSGRHTVCVQVAQF